MENVQLDAMTADQIFDTEQAQIIETTLQEFDNNVAYAKKLIRLLDNQDFIDIISDDYIEHDAERLGGLLTTSNIKVAEKQDLIFEQIKAKRHLRKWIEHKYGTLTPYLEEGARDALVKELDDIAEENRNG
jgi:hypothetical protein